MAFSGYLGLALLATWPLALHLGDRFPGASALDAWGHYWNIWWFKVALTTGRDLFHTDMWYPPEGVSLLLATPTPFNSALGLLPQVLAGPLIAYNIVALLAVALSGQAAFLLARHLTGHAGAAVAAGVAFGASPYLLGHLNVGHLNVAMLPWLPLFALGLLRAAEGRRAGVALAALCLPLSALTEWHTTLGALLLTGLMIAWSGWLALRQAGPWGAPLRMALAGALGAALTAPYALATARAAAAVGARAEIGVTAAEDYSANLLAYLLPHDLHPLWGGAIFVWRRANVWEVPTEARLSLGWTVLLLAGVGLWAGRRALLPWLGLALLGVALALGPSLRVGPWEYKLPMPFDLFSALPYMNVSRTPARFSLLVVLAAAVLCAYGVRRLGDTIAGGRRPGLVVAGATLLLLAELMTAPFRLSVPPDRELAEQIGRELAASDPAATILTLPTFPLEQKLLFHQVHHERPIYSVGGSLWRDIERPFRTQTPGFADLIEGKPFRDMVQPADPLAVLGYFRVRYVLLYSGDVPPARAEALRATLRRVLGQPGPAHVARDGTLEAWRVPPAPAPGAFLRTGAGWYPLESWTGLGPGRWMGATADLYLERPAAAAVTVAFSALSFGGSRRLEVRAGDAVLDTFTVTPKVGEIRLRLPAAAGATRLTLRSLDGTISPREAAGLADNRQLSVGLARVRVEPVAAGP